MTNTQKIKEKIKKTLRSVKKKIKGKEPSEKKELTKKQKIKREAMDWGISIAAALLIYFVVLPAILGTSTPMIVVSSCSQQPHLNIGDLLIIQGVQMEDIEAPTVTIEGQLNYTYDKQTNTLTINDHEISPNTNNSIVTYLPSPTGTQIIHRALVKLEFTEQAEPIQGEKILLTQGDANEIPDQITRTEVNGERALCLDYTREGMILQPQHGPEDQELLISQDPEICLSTPATEERIIGRKKGPRIPLLGHIKLFFCDVAPICEGHSNPGTSYEYKLTC